MPPPCPLSFPLAHYTASSLITGGQLCRWTGGPSSGAWISVRGSREPGDSEQGSAVTKSYLKSPHSSEHTSEWAAVCAGAMGRSVSWQLALSSSDLGSTDNTRQPHCSFHCDRFPHTEDACYFRPAGHCHAPAPGSPKIPQHLSPSGPALAHHGPLSAPSPPPSVGLSFLCLDSPPLAIIFTPHREADP